MNRLKIGYSFEKQFVFLFDFGINKVIGHGIATSGNKKPLVKFSLYKEFIF